MGPTKPYFRSQTQGAKGSCSAKESRVQRVQLKCTRYRKFSGNLEVKGGFDAPLPEYTGGGEVSLLIGLQDKSLDPVLLEILHSLLGVYQCPFVDV